MKFVTDSIPSYKQYIANIEQKMMDKDFIDDTKQYIRQNELFNAEEAYTQIKESLLALFL